MQWINQKLTLLSKEDAQDSEFYLFFGKIQQTINCFRDLLTFFMNFISRQQKIEIFLFPIPNSQFKIQNSKFKIPISFILYIMRQIRSKMIQCAAAV